jgi:phosphate transport system protein
MSRETWPYVTRSNRGDQDATRIEVLETIDSRAPETKAELATQMGLSEHYLSELLQELKSDGMIRKAYVVNDEAVFENASTVSELSEETHPEMPPQRTELLTLLRRLAEVTTDQYTAARATFAGDTPEQSADQLEGLANERVVAVFNKLKSFTLTTDWPGNRIAADLATIAKSFEIVGDQACFISAVVQEADTDPSGTIQERTLDVFDDGQTINAHLRAILFDGKLSRTDELHTEEAQVHRNLDELFELVTAYEPAMYGSLVTVIRALERSIRYWVEAAETAVQLHSGIEPEHLSVYNW